jgi:hypothetical protein
MVKRRNPVAKALRLRRFGLRIVRNRMRYFRKVKHPKRGRDDQTGC